jgi:hypothetical protein
MSKIDYNSSTFRNAAIDRFQGKFCQPKPRAASTPSATLGNPFQKKSPLAGKLVDTSIKIPKAPAAKPTEAKPETKPTAMAAEAKAPAAAPKTVKQVKQENKVAKLEARGKNAVSKVEARGSKTTEEKMGLREKRAQNAGNFVRGALEIAGLAATTATTIRSAKKN